MVSDRISVDSRAAQAVEARSAFKFRVQFDVSLQGGTCPEALRPDRAHSSPGKCTPVGFNHAEMVEAMEAGTHVKGTAMECSRGKSLLNPVDGGIVNSQKKDWHLMIQSYNMLLEYANIAKGEELEASDAETIHQVIDQLTIFQNTLRHIFGVPGGSLSNRHLGKPENILVGLDKNDLESYITSISSLISALDIPMSLPKSLHHIQVAGNNCILQFIEYIRRYNLVPYDVGKSLQILLRSQLVVEWLVDSSRAIFRPGSKFDNEYRWRLYDEIQLKNHFQLTHYNNLYQQLSKTEKDWLLFQYLASRMNYQAEKAILESIIEPKKFCKPMFELIQFLIKIKELILEELERSNPHISIQKFMIDRKVDLVKMIKFIIEPKVEPGISFQDLHLTTNNIFATLDFFMSRFGSDLNEKAEMKGVNENAAEFREKFKLIRLATNICIWRDMIFDYDDYYSKNKSMAHKIPEHEWLEKRKFYWENLIKNVNSYRSTRNYQLSRDPQWREKINSNSYYKYLTDKYDLECEKLERMYQKSESSTVQAYPPI
ncbi:hypothetical protein VP01_1639g12 [Puccinia sorghi]|uniref:Uncharacterized protein n=1 Tax=Puccinia sorghi TaxID=27349 RepID=A0A0L6VIL1_9BASI|nr:hypothetical protein VP01_1639g12 [Puccinia sorghi]